jgi:hypothetical protein
MDFTLSPLAWKGIAILLWKLPCGQDAIPKITIATGVAPKLNTLDLGNAIINGILDGKEVSPSTRGQSCLFHSDLPNGVTDIK